MTTDEARQTRMMVRQTYGSHPKSRVRGTESVTLKFVMGKPREKYKEEVDLENDSECCQELLQ